MICCHVCQVGLPCSVIVESVVPPAPMLLLPAPLPGMPTACKGRSQMLELSVDRKGYQAGLAISLHSHGRAVIAEL